MSMMLLQLLDKNKHHIQTKYPSSQTMVPLVKDHLLSLPLPPKIIRKTCFGHMKLKIWDPTNATIVKDASGHPWYKDSTKHVSCLPLRMEILFLIHSPMWRRWGLVALFQQKGIFSFWLLILSLSKVITGENLLSCYGTIAWLLGCFKIEFQMRTNSCIHWNDSK
jgi:hypothetical protein